MTWSQFFTRAVLFLTAVLYPVDVCYILRLLNLALCDVASCTIYVWRDWTSQLKTPTVPTEPRASLSQNTRNCHCSRKTCGCNNETKATETETERWGLFWDQQPITEHRSALLFWLISARLRASSLGSHKLKSHTSFWGFKIKALPVELRDCCRRSVRCFYFERDGQ